MFLDSGGMKIESSILGIKNVKIHFKLTSPLTDLDSLKKSDFSIKKHSNYYIVREKSGYCVYSIFLKSGYVNVTGIRKFSQIVPTLQNFNKKFKQNITIDKVKVDNSTVTGRFEILYESKEEKKPKIYLNLEQIKFLLDNHTEYKHIKANLTPANFPGIIIRSKNLPTALVFTSARFTIVGGKTKQSIVKTHQQLCAIIEKYMKIFTPATSTA